DDLDRGDLALAQLINDEVARDREKVDAKRGDAVVGRARRILERAHEGLLHRVVEIERLRVAPESKTSLAAAKCEPMVEKSCQLGQIRVIHLFQDPRVSSAKSSQPSSIVEEGHLTWGYTSPI